MNPKTIRVGLGQINPTVGNFRGNLEKILAFIRQAEEKNCDLVVFPEMALCGYPVWDLAINRGFIAQNLHSLKEIVKFSRSVKVSIVTGYIDEGPRNSGKSRNALAWITHGKIKLKQYKRLLPTYDVFLEEIFFQPGDQHRVLSWKGLKVGTAVCEDLWDQRYTKKPLHSLSDLGSNLLIAINASPYHREVARVRDELLKHQSRTYGLPIIYVNQVGSQDDLVFDGRSLVMDEKGQVLYRAPVFEEGLFVYDWEVNKKNNFSLPLPPTAGTSGEIYQALVVGVRDYVEKNRFKSVVIGLSGGVDSALTAVIARDALGANRVVGVTMPGLYSSVGSWKDSEELAKNLGIEFRVHSILKGYGLFLSLRQKRKVKGVKPVKKITLGMENLQARLRGLELMFISNEEGRLVLTTGNKSELAMGYCTLYGDMAGGLCVLGDVYKTDVYRLAHFRNAAGRVIPEATLTKPPSAELRPNQKDQDTLPPYEILDEILRLYIEKNQSPDEISRILRRKNVSQKTIKEVIHRVDHNEYKRRQAPPILRVTEKAWFGRRMPITNQFQNC